MNGSDLIQHSAAKIAVRNLITANAPARHAFNKQRAEFQQLIELKHPERSKKSAYERASEMVLMRWILAWELDQLKKA